MKKIFKVLFWIFFCGIAFIYYFFKAMLKTPKKRRRDGVMTTGAKGGKLR